MSEEEKFTSHGAKVRREAIKLDAALGDWDVFSQSFGWFRWKLRNKITTEQEGWIARGFRGAG